MSELTEIEEDLVLEKSHETLLKILEVLGLHYPSKVSERRILQILNDLYNLGYQNGYNESWDDLDFPGEEDWDTELKGA